MKPEQKPANPNFSSGPCSKHPGYSLGGLDTSLLGRSHRSKPGKARLKEAIEKTRQVLGIPEDYLIGIVPASDTGAFEMAMWSMLGARGVDVLAWEAFGSGWAGDITNELRLEDVRSFQGDYGKLPELAEVDFKRDVVFTWNGTTSGVCVPDGDWIPGDREGLTLCDATSAVFAMEIPWEKLDVTTYSWQKVLGGEAAHGMLILSPRAARRLEEYKPAWPMPKIFRLLKKGKLNKGIFEGSTINTPSMLCVEDYLDALQWVEDNGGLDAMLRRSRSNLEIFEEFVASREWIHFLAGDRSIRSNTSICLTLDLDAEKIGKMVSLLDEEGVAYDCKAYRDAPAGLRFWGGATIENEDIRRLLPWLDWAYETVSSS